MQVAANSPAITAPAPDCSARARYFSSSTNTRSYLEADPMLATPSTSTSHPRAGELRQPRQSLAGSASWLSLYSRPAMRDQEVTKVLAQPHCCLPAAAGLRNRFMEKKVFWITFRCSACSRTFAADFGGAWPRPFPILFASWWVTWYRSDWF